MSQKESNPLDKLKQEAKELAGDPIAAIVKDVFQKDKDAVIGSPAYQAHKAAFMEKMKGVVSPAELQPKAIIAQDNTRYSDIPKSIDKADEKMEAQLKQSFKVCGPNAVALIRTSDPAQVSQALATAERIKVDCMIATPDGLVLHGNTPAMESVREKFEGVMENGNTLPVRPETNVGALVNGVFADYKTQSIMEQVNQYGVTEKPGVSFVVAPGVTLQEAARMTTAMESAGLHNPAVVMGRNGTSVLLSTQNEVGQAMAQRHAPTGEAPGFAQFKFDSKLDAAQFLTEMSDVDRELGDAVRMDEGIGMDENDTLDTLE